MSKECRRDDSFVTAIAHCHGDAGEANGDGENGPRWLSYLSHPVK